MKKKSFRQLLCLLATVISLQLSASSHVAARIGDGAAPSALAPMSATPVDTRFAMPETFKGHSDIRTSFSNFTMPADASRKTMFKVPGSNINILGSVVYSASQPNGFYRIPINAGSGLEAIYTETNKVPDTNFGAVAIDGVYYVAWQYNFFDMMLINYVDSYDMNTWEKLSHNEIKNSAMFASDVSLDPVSGLVYGCYINNDGDGYVFGIGDYVNLSRAAIAPITTPWNGVAFDSDGTLYAIDMNGDLLIVDKGTGSTTKVGSTGVTPKYQSSAVIDPKSHRMFWSVFGEDQTGRFYEVDKSTGAATMLYQFPGNEEVCGLVVIAPEAEDYAPAAVTELCINFHDGSLSGTVDFTAPDTYFCGDAAIGNISYSVLANGAEVATGTTSFGSPVKAPVTLTEAGDYEFAVSVSTAEGSSPLVKKSAFIGADTPVATKATLTRDGENLVLTWMPVTESVNGGYIDVDNITYTVTRYPDAIVVAENLSATKFIEPIPAGNGLISYYYTVVAHAANLTSGTATSNSITTGSVTPPYTSEFKKATGLDGFTILNVNNDDKVWTLKNSAAYLRYSSYLDSDDWLITPPMRLQKGKTYRLGYIIYTESGSYKEKIEVKWGAAPTVDGMTETILEPYEFSSLSDVSFESYITPDADGVYYVGFHGMSTKYMYGLFIKEISISEGTDLQSPAAATDITAVPDYNGDNKATVKFNAPALNVKGDKLDAITKIELRRNGDLINTFNNPAPGEALSYLDEVEEAGNYTYSVIAYNNAGAGKETSFTTFIGINLPGTVTNLVASETANPGEVTFSWDAATTDADGNPMNPSLINYSIFEFTTSSKYIPVVENLNATTYTFRAVPADGEQQMKQWVVCAGTASGLGAPVATDLICVGPNYKMPYIESIAGGKLSSNFSMDQSNGGVWRLYNSQTLSEPVSVDGDDGLFGMKGNGPGTFGSIISGKIEISGDKPGLMFYTFNINGNDPATGSVVPDENILNVYVRSGNIETRVLNIEMKSLHEAGWNCVTVPLDAYIGKVIYLRFEGICVNYTYTLVDNIRVVTLTDNDIAVASVEAPANVKAGDEFNVNVKLDNLGTNIADSYTVSLYRDGEKVAESKGSALQPGLNTTVSFRQTIKVIEDETAEYSAEASLDGDSNPNNNKSDSPAVVIAEFPTYPTPAGLIASHADSRVLLSWDAPVIDTTAPDAVTETFESAEPFATTVAGWTFLDLDEKAIGGLSGIKFPGIATYSKQSFFVLDNSDAQFNATFETRSGNKCIVAMFDSYFGEINDWAISPELCGKAQTISVYARSYDSRYKESIELLYSTGSLDPADFISAGKHEQISDEWTEYTAELPEGALYFAIRSCAIGASMLMVDDVTYIPASANTRLEHIGYNVYRNGEKLNDTPVTDTTITDTLAQPGFHTYAVTALYNVGESRPAKADINVMSGIDGITADDNAPAEYFNLQGIRVDSPRTGNIYIRRQGSKAAKVIF